MTKINQLSSEFSVSEFKGKQRMDSGRTAPRKQGSTVPEGFGASVRFMEQWKQAGAAGRWDFLPHKAGCSGNKARVLGLSLIGWGCTFLT